MSEPDPVMPAQQEINKANIETTESIHKPTQTTRGKDKAAKLLAANERIIVTSVENKQVLRKIDLVILPILLSVYFLQSLDKTTLSYASVFGLIEDANLDPNSQQYSWLGSIVYIAQLVMQPLVAFFLVKFPTGKFTGVMVFIWGVVLCGMAGAKNFAGLMATRFLLGAFESAVGKSLGRWLATMYLTPFSTCFHSRGTNVVQALRANEP
jgi:MFS family permease